MKNFNGLSSFVWFSGIVEDRIDPAKANRVRVRIHGLDSEKLSEMPLSEIIWAQVMLPATSSGVNGLGESVHGLVEGSLVIGFFMDGEKMQDPIIMGSLSGIPIDSPNKPTFCDPRKDLSKAPNRVESLKIGADGSGTKIKQAAAKKYPFILDEPDVNRLARNENTNKTIAEIRKNNLESGVATANGGSWSEPPSKFAPVYPYNKVRETESGHVVEYDDTPGAERIMVWHRSGSFIEVLPDGSVVQKTANDQINVVQKNSNSYTKGSQTITINKGLKVYVNKAKTGEGLDIQVGSGSNLNLVVDGGDVNAKITGKISIDASGDVDAKSGGNIFVEASGNTEIKSGGNIDITAGGALTLTGATISIN